MLTEDFVRLQPIVEEECRKLAETNPGVEADDIEGHVWLFLTKEWRFFAGKDGGYCRVGIRKEGVKHCAEERYRFTHYSAQYVYLPVEIRALLQHAFFEAEPWENVPVPGDYKLSVADGNSGNVVVALWDMRDAFESLKTSEQEVLRRRYELDEELTETEMRRSLRAIDNMTRFLNTKVVQKQEAVAAHDGPGARKAISNAKSIYLTEL